MLRPVAREFVIGFAVIPTYVYQADFLIDEAQQLFDKTNTVLVEGLSIIKAKALYEWGNQLRFSQQLEYALRFFEETISQIVDTDNSTTYSGSRPISTTSLDRLKSIIQRHRAESKERLDSLDAIDGETIEDQWGKTLFELVRAIWENQLGIETPTNPTPTNELAAWIEFFRAKSLLNAVHDSLSEDELAALNNLFRSHPKWSKAHTRTQLYYRPLDLFELVHEI